MFEIASTIKDVAKYTGLSIATISKYINGGNVLEKNKVKIEEAINVLNYRVNELARGLKTNRSMTVGVLIPNFENIFFTSIISNVENILIKNRYSTILCDYRGNPDLEKSKLDFLMSKMVDGIIIVPSGRDIDHIQDVIEKGIPVILIDRILEGIECDAILVDNVSASYDAVEEFIVRGHKRIGIIGGPKDIYTTQERIMGYVNVHDDYGIKMEDSLIKYGDYDIQSGYYLMEELIQMENPPTGIFVTNYEMTLGAIMASNDKDIKIPDEVSLMGFDNIQMAKIIKPSLSIVTQPIKKIGEMAAKVLIRRLQGDYSDFPNVNKLKTSVLIKDSMMNICKEL